ncbi:fatty acid desaturase 6-like [Acanthaster planci]|uniref:Fatty acid desaturase 6-like n=1 Tax=Acanthaster planci TaxID=133434 RepID=A0A8B7YVK7_ACAPL|nr:fatty acid desaturase 6-like [Acanthaster planci]
MERKSMKQANGEVLSDTLNGGSMSELTHAVQAIQSRASWWDLYGVDWCIIASGFALVPPGLLLLGYPTWPPFVVGILLMGFFYGMVKTKMAHLAIHSALCRSKIASHFWEVFFVEFLGSFSAEFSKSTHVKIHHPHTNIIGLGDSSTWRVPFLPCLIYMFVAPLFLPPLYPVLAVVFLLQEEKVKKAVQCAVVVTLGLIANISLLVYVSGLSLTTAVLSLLSSRAVMEIPYIHVNIFQHIGLSMYLPENRPPRLYMMSSGVLNLSHNLLLDWNFGHSLIGCHIEHHLFPKLSDNMCLKIRPIVKKYLQDHKLPYHEKEYVNRLKLFVKEYKALMVNAPPITEFIGIQ